MAKIKRNNVTNIAIADVQQQIHVAEYAAAAISARAFLLCLL